MAWAPFVACVALVGWVVLHLAAGAVLVSAGWAQGHADPAVEARAAACAAVHGMDADARLDVSQIEDRRS